MDYDSFNVPRGTMENYISLLKAWNRKINLVSFKTEDELISRHILDSLQLKKYIDSEEVVFDIGSGAGFPGLMLSYSGIKKIILVEKSAKKAAFLNAAASLSFQKIEVCNKNLKELVAKDCNVITARGFAELDSIFNFTNNLIEKETRFLLLKGKNIENEIKKASKTWNFECIMNKSETSEDGCVLEIRSLARK